MQTRRKSQIVSQLNVVFHFGTSLSNNITLVPQVSFRPTFRTLRPWQRQPTCHMVFFFFGYKFSSLHVCLKLFIIFFFHLRTIIFSNPGRPNHNHHPPPAPPSTPPPPPPNTPILFLIPIIAPHQIQPQKSPNSWSSSI